jgi:hypothetical protein
MAREPIRVILSYTDTHSLIFILLHLMPESIVGLDTLSLAVVVVQLGEAEKIQGELQGVVVVEELDATGDGKDNVGVVLDRQGVDGAGVLANPIARTGNPVVSRSID